PSGTTLPPQLQTDGTPQLPGTPPSRIETSENTPPLPELPPLPEFPAPASTATAVDNTTAVAEPAASKETPSDTTTTADTAASNAALPQDPFMMPGENPGAALHQIEGTDQFDMARDQNPGAVLGITIASARVESPNQPGKYEDRFLLLPGNDVNLVFTTVGDIPQACNATFTITDFYESRMTLYDSSFVFVPIRTLQELRGMIDPVTGEGGFSQILIKVKPGASSSEISKRLADNPAFPPELFTVYTWEEQPEVKPLLDAVKQELVMINMLLFLIIAVAGFGILAIFFMIVFEKTRDIGILKSLGASSGGIMAVFLSYGLALGCIGCGLGVLLGLLFVRYINTIAQILAKVTGLVVFDPSVYYFYEIPTVVEPATVIRILLGALFVAVVASVLPAIRAARLHPVRALRHE
ncbi:MAG: FtsX-like permease family protein, partial [Thermoguttaceae bacterium]|nr:FtsX-like permease family protein [Thermoguttaceae bacterium]